MRRRPPRQPNAAQMIREYLGAVSTAATRRLPKGDRLLFVGRTRAAIEARVGPLASADADAVAAALTALGDPDDLAAKERERLYSARRRGAAAQPPTLWKPPGKTSRRATPPAKPQPKSQRSGPAGPDPAGGPAEPRPAGGPAEPRPRRSRTWPYRRTGEPPGPSAGPAPAGPGTPAGRTGPGAGHGTAGPGSPGRSVGPGASGGSVGPGGAGGTVGPGASAGTVGPGAPGGSTGPGTSGGTIGPDASGRTVGPGAPGGTAGPGISPGTAGPGGPGGPDGAGAHNGATGTGAYNWTAGTGAHNGTAPGGRNGAAPGQQSGTAPGGRNGAAPGQQSGTAPGGRNGAAPGQQSGTAPGGRNGARPGQRRGAGAPDRQAGDTRPGPSVPPAGPASGPATPPGVAPPDGTKPQSIVPGMASSGPADDEPAGRGFGPPAPLTEAWLLARKNPLEAVAVVVLGVGGLLLPFPMWLAGGLIAVFSRRWGRRDKWLALIGPPGFAVICMLLLGVSGGGNFFHALAQASHQFGLLLRVGSLLSAGYLVWRLRRGPRRRKTPPWLRYR